MVRSALTLVESTAHRATAHFHVKLAENVPALSGNLRRLTTDGNDGWIIPEFTWDPTNSYLFWTESRFPDGMRVPPMAGLFLIPEVRETETPADGSTTPAIQI